MRRTAARSLREALPYLDGESQKVLSFALAEALGSSSEGARRSAAWAIRKVSARLDEETRLALALKIVEKLALEYSWTAIVALTGIMERLLPARQVEVVEKQAKSSLKRFLSLSPA
ncbi:MAG: hypothetical protein NZ651_05215 [Candidatus Bipolaricaulota bacterium]|nr:hypothetical protein [Candidatus Bipolaricaulota bacterium]MDW8127152.1 hypothetical protein [Candidatus Bipolaricaulota bacterium]